MAAFATPYHRSVVVDVGSRFQVAAARSLRASPSGATRQILLVILYHVQLADRPASGYPFITEGREIEGAVAAVDDQLGDGTADRGRLLDAVATKAGGEDQALDLGMAADDAVVIKRVVFVVASPGVHHLGRLEGWHPAGQRR